MREHVTDVSALRGGLEAGVGVKCIVGMGSGMEGLEFHPGNSNSWFLMSKFNIAGDHSRSG